MGKHNELLIACILTSQQGEAILKRHRMLLLWSPWEQLLKSNNAETLTLSLTPPASLPSCVSGLFSQILH